MPGSLGRFLLFTSAALMLAGFVLVLVERYRIPVLGRLPGDIRVERPGYSFYFPWVSFVALSLVLTVILNLILGLWRR